MEYVYKIGKKLKQLREENHFTQLQVADELGGSPNTYSDYEREISRVPSEVVVKATEFYKKGLDYFYNLRGPVNITMNDHSTMGFGYVETNHGVDPVLAQRMNQHIDGRSIQLEQLYVKLVELIERMSGGGKSAS